MHGIKVNKVPLDKQWIKVKVQLLSVQLYKDVSMSLEQFKEKRKQWIHCFSGEDRHSIIKQIYNMVWNAAVFKVVNEARRIATNNGEKQAELNGMLHRFIDRCFFDSQLLAVRRLCDPHPFDGPKGVFSLISLINDMKQYVGLMTRANFFADEGLEYDIEVIRQKEWQYFQEHTKNGSGALWIPNEVDSHSVEQRHNEIDTLTGINKDQRSPDDTVCTNILDFLIGRIKISTDNIKLRVDQNVAHAASPQSRQYKDSDEVSLTLNCLWESHKIICQIANFLDIYLLSRASHTFLPIPQYNHLEFIENPLIGSERVGLISNAWHEFHRETDSWGSWGIKELKEEMCTSTKAVSNNRR